MNNHKRRFSVGMLWFAVFSVFGVVPAGAQAAFVAIDKLSVDYVTLSVQIPGSILVPGGLNYNFTGPVIPPAVITMGLYQDPIVKWHGQRHGLENLFQQYGWQSRPHWSS